MGESSFADYGPQNTDMVIEAVRKRIEREGTRNLVVASTSGETGMKFLNSLGNRVRIVVVSHREMNPALKEKIGREGGIVIEKSHLPLHEEEMDGVREAFRTFGQGAKVAVEVILIASDRGELLLGEDVIGVGGTARGADTAIVARATLSDEIFGRDEKRRLEIREILVMPKKKKWW